MTTKYLVIRGVGSEVLAVSGPVQLDDMGGVAKAATQSAVLPVVLLHLHHHRGDVVKITMTMTTHCTVA